MSYNDNRKLGTPYNGNEPPNSLHYPLVGGRGFCSRAEKKKPEKCL
jgi:hypothetical protein